MNTTPTTLSTLDWTSILIFLSPIVGNLMFDYLNDWAELDLNTNKATNKSDSPNPIKQRNQKRLKMFLSLRTGLIALLAIILIILRKDVYAPSLAFVGTAFITIFKETHKDKNRSMQWKGIVLFTVTSLFLGLIIGVKPLFTLDDKLNSSIAYILIFLGMVPAILYAITYKKKSTSSNSRSKEIIIKVNPILAQNFDAASALEKRKINAYLNFQLQKYLEPSKSLQETMDKLGQEAKENGLTPEILQSILDDE